MNNETEAPLTVKEVVMYECPICGDQKRWKDSAERCLDLCSKAQRASVLLEEGKTLQEINDATSVFSTVPEHLREVTKENCFTIEYLQCCSKPAYQIRGILPGGIVELWGYGGWSGCYGSEYDLTSYVLNDPRPASELYRYKEPYWS